MPLAARISTIASQFQIEVTPAQISPILHTVDTTLFRAYMHSPDLWASDRDLSSHWREYYMAIFSALGAKGDLDACALAIYELYNKPGIWKLYPDVLPTLAALKARGYTVGVVSDWSSALPANILLPLGVGPYVSFVITSATQRLAKPAHGLYEEALARARVPAHKAVHVGDNYVTDILGARSAGIRGVLLDRNGVWTMPLDCPLISSLDQLLVWLDEDSASKNHAETASNRKTVEK